MEIRAKYSEYNNLSTNCNILDKYPWQLNC